MASYWYGSLTKYRDKPSVPDRGQETTNMSTETCRVDTKCRDLHTYMYGAHITYIYIHIY